MAKRRRDLALPLPLRRLRAATYACFFAAAVLQVTCLVALWRFGGFRMAGGLSMASVVPFFVFGIGGAYMVERRRRALIALLRMNQWRLCTVCAYPLEADFGAMRGVRARDHAARGGQRVVAMSVGAVGRRSRKRSTLRSHVPEPRPPVTLPRALARYDRGMIVCTLATLPLMVAFIVAISLVNGFAWSTSAMALISASVIQVAAFCVIRRARRRLIRRAMQADGLLCTACLYQLERDSPRCPECGQHTSAHQCRLVWMECC